MANGSVRLQLLQGNFDYEKEGLLDSTHLHYYTAREIEKVIDSSGLIATKVDYTTFSIDKKTIDRVLEKVGLKNSAAFTEFINVSDSVVYQYVVEISKQGDVVKMVQPMNTIKPKIDYESQLEDIQADCRRLFKEKVQKDSEIGTLSTELDKKTQELGVLIAEKEKLLANPFVRFVKKILKR